MERIKISDEAKCVAAAHCFPLNGMKEMKRKWTEKHDLFLDKVGRVFALVDSADSVYFMDAITGSLYQFGNCLTSDTLKAGSLKRNNKKATELLLGMKVEAESDELASAA